MNIAELKQIQEAFRNNQIDFGQNYDQNSNEIINEEINEQQDEIEETTAHIEQKNVRPEQDLYYSVSEMLRRQR